MKSNDIQARVKAINLRDLHLSIPPAHRVTVGRMERWSSD